MTIEDVEASFFKYLYDELEVSHGVAILEDINLASFDGMEKWVVIDSLSNPLGAEPKQIYFLHIAVQKGMKRSKALLNSLVSLVDSVVNKGVAIAVYDSDTTAEIGGMTVSKTSLSPVLPHYSGGMFRSMTVEIVYEGK